MSGSKERDHSLADFAYHRVLLAISACEIAPGQVLSTEEVAKKLSISRTPAQEALKRLAIQGLVEIRPHAGHFVRPLLMTDLREVFEMRLGIESVTIQLALRRASDVELEKLSYVEAPEHLPEPLAPWSRELEEERPELYTLFHQVVRHNAFHITIADLAGNSRLTKIVQGLFMEAIRPMMLFYLKLFERGQSLQTGVSTNPHAEITEAMQARRVDKAVQAMRNHIVDGFNQLKTIFEAQQRDNDLSPPELDLAALGPPLSNSELA